MCRGLGLNIEGRSVFTMVYVLVVKEEVGCIDLEESFDAPWLCD